MKGVMKDFDELRKWWNEDYRDMHMSERDMAVNFGNWVFLLHQPI